MCDLGQIGLMGGGSQFSGVAAGASDFVGPRQPLPWLQPAAGLSTGELLKGFSGVAGVFGEAQQFDDAADQRERRAGQILETTSRTLNVKSLQQDLARGKTVAAIGRSGVTKSGSASRLLERQDMLDELVLEAAKQRGILQIGAELSEADAAKTKRDSRILRGLAQGAEFAAEGFGF